MSYAIILTDRNNNLIHSVIYAMAPLTGSATTVP